MDITTLRKDIDSVDQDLLGLLAKRYALSKKVASTKREQEIPLLDANREHEILQFVHQNLPEEIPLELAENFFRCILKETRRQLQRPVSKTLLEPRKIAIIGLGLIGGSLAKALSATEVGHLLFGVDVSERLDAPSKSGLFESLHSPDYGQNAVKDADLIFLCTPVDEAIKLLPRIKADAKPGAIISDVCGFKEKIVNAAEDVFTDDDGPFFVGGHPMSGRETAGFETSTPDLFRDRPWVLTPRPKANIEPLKELQRTLQGIGAVIRLLTPDEHDRTVVTVSHLPQLASVALSMVVGGRDRGISGSGLMDMTRLASSPVALWNSLLMERRSQEIDELQRLRAYLTELEIALALKEPLDKWFARANKHRKAMELAAHNPEP
ncbi:prephenate dehydrogenase/arogenate dehydrogenase family protein [Planctomycetota bacterium]|nr:prephenate dehydrogenase/arogenate dehydrogenase family protein [Planctomycetota bacterium]